MAPWGLLHLVWNKVMAMGASAVAVKSVAGAFAHVGHAAEGLGESLRPPEPPSVSDIAVTVGTSG
jgi:hypothetical protein